MSAPLVFVRQSYAARPILEQALADRDGSRDCFYCGKRYANSIDHVTARFKGGSDGIANLVFACWPCNEVKNTKPGWLFVLERSWDLVRGTSALRVAWRQPPEAVDPLPDRPHTQHLDQALAERLDQAVSESRPEGEAVPATRGAEES